MITLIISLLGMLWLIVALIIGLKHKGKIDMELNLWKMKLKLSKDE